MRSYKITEYIEGGPFMEQPILAQRIAQILYDKKAV